MAEETIDSINKSTDMGHLSIVENNLNYYISLLDDKKNLTGSFHKRLTNEAIEYGIPSLDEYIKLKSRYYHSLKETCINRMIELSQLDGNTARRCGTSSITI